MAKYALLVAVVFIAIVAGITAARALDRRPTGSVKVRVVNRPHPRPACPYGATCSPTTGQPCVFGSRCP